MSVLSETMMGLLKELALLKELDSKDKGGPRSELELSEFEQRKNRRREITDRIQALGEAVS